MSPPPSSATDTSVLTADERFFLTAAVDRLIPADELSPAASDCGVVTYIDGQLAGPYGAGARLYRDGPHQTGKPGHGYQLALTPLELIRAGIAAADVWCQATYGNRFADLDEAGQIATLEALDVGSATLDGVPAKAFFEAMLALTMEGFFADPSYGGNRDQAGWKMVGYPDPTVPLPPRTAG